MGTRGKTAWNNDWWRDVAESVKRLDLDGDVATENAIRQAFDQGEVYLRQLDVNLATGTIVSTGFGKVPPSTSPLPSVLNYGPVRP